MDKIKIVYKKVEELIPYINNPRDNTKAVDKVASSIKNFGFKVPIVVDKDNEIVAGHTRILASKKLGLEEVPCIVADDLDESQIKAFRLADNKVSELAEWDFELLGLELESLKDFDMSEFGFEEVDFKDNFKDDNFDIDVEVNEIKEKEPESKQGQIYKLGDHLLMCGDSTNLEQVKQIVDQGGVDLVVTDPPYNVNYEGTAGKIQNDNMSNESFLNFLEDTFKVMRDCLKEGGAYYVWHADTNRLYFSQALKSNDLEERQNLIWVKKSLVLGRQDYNWKHEPCLYGWKPGAAHYFINDFTNTTTFDDEPNLSKMTKEELRDYAELLLKLREDGTTILREAKPSTNPLHPTMKPVPLIAKQIKNSSKKGEIVLDLFGGSGTTLIAAEQTGRKARLVELDPVYVDVIIHRWEKFTGKKAELINK